jgi:hypothetical protein
MINPAEIPQIPGNIEAVGEYGVTLRTQGQAFATTGSDVDSSWQGLSAVYTAPEAAQLFAATGPVRERTGTVGADVGAVGNALVAYADEVGPIKAELASLRTQAEAFVRVATADPDWRANPALVEENNRLIAAVDTQVADWMTAQRDCANAIDARYGGTHYVPDNGDAVQNPDEYGYSAAQLDQAATGEQGLPWGTADERDKPWWEDGLDGAGSFVEGFVVDGAWGTVQGLGNLVGFGGEEALSQSWEGLGKLALGFTPIGIINNFTDLPGLPQGTIAETLDQTGRALFAVDEWGEDPARAAGAVVFNVGSIIFGTKGAGAGARGLGAAAEGAEAAGLAARVSGRVADFIGRVKARIPEIRLPEVFRPDDFSPGLKRLDHDFTDPLNEKGIPKAHLDDAGNLDPANPHGTIQPYQHVLGNRDPVAKANSQYSSWTPSGHDAKIFGGKEKLYLDIDRLRGDIASGRLPGVEVLPPEKVQGSIQAAIDQAAGKHVEVDLPPKARPSQLQDFVRELGISKTAGTQVAPRIQALLNSRRDLEWLVKGTIPHDYLRGPFPGPKG